MNLSYRFFAAASLATIIATSAFAQSSPMRVRGPVTAMQGSSLTVKGRDGDVAVKLADNWSVGGRVPAKLADIKAGDFLGVAAVPQTGGVLRAVEVFIFPAGVKSGEGHRPWDLLPEGTMTNATVAETVKAVSGQTIKMTYPGGDKTIFVPEDAAITISAPAEKSDVKIGSVVFLSAEKQGDGSLVANRVTVNLGASAQP
ncbi:DUF5666 domain-containing protein [Terrarubrum flagellatum]|uniref:DUF5666 domain-containing protein n=1 Tax=Terrirubrum flagellatum TaxID=2895980 RepID=UPI00314510E2